MKIVGVSTSLLLISACASNLTYVSDTDCSSDVKFDMPIRRSEELKIQKREMRNRVIELTSDMAGADIPCLTGVSGGELRYQVFEIPSGMTGRVVSAGSKLATAVIFAADIETYDAEGNNVRRFDDKEYRRQGTIYGVQFLPSESEKYVLVKATPELVAARDATVETSTSLQNVTVAYGSTVSSGTNTIGSQRIFDRTYSYNGVVAVRTVFPKQEKK